jgi:acetoin utilization deacetylase AcuC-like enzyme
MLVLHHPDQALHDPETVFRTGRMIAQPDRAERYHIFLGAMRDGGHRIEVAPLGGLDPVLALHDPDYVEFLRTAWERWSAHPDFGPVAIPNVHPTHRMQRKPTDFLGAFGWYSNSTSCQFTATTWTSVHASAQTAIHAADRLTATSGPVYALCRPPGHHAYPDLMTGACYLNNSAIAAHRLAGRFGKVALVDIDVHHGNGSQFMFYNRGDVLFCSLHIDPNLSAPFYAGHADETGVAAGLGLTLNLPLPWGTEDGPWLKGLDAILAKIAAFAPAALAISLGFDAGKDDPVATFRISPDGFAEAGRKLASLALPTVLVQEGGYLSPSLGTYLTRFVRGFEAAMKDEG